MNEQNAIDNSPITFSIGKDECISTDSANRKNFGYTALSKIYHELEINKFLINRQRHTKEDYDANTIMKLTCISHTCFILLPRKKLMKTRVGSLKNQIFRWIMCTDVFHSFYKHKDALQLWLHEHIKNQYQRNTKLVYYDVQIIL